MRKQCLIICFFLFLGACAKTTTTAKYPTPVTPEIQKAYNEAQSLVSAKRFQQADQAYQNFITVYGYNSLTDKAYFKRGEISFLYGDYRQALENYQQAYARNYSAELTPKARFKAAYSLFYLDKFQQALEELSQIQRQDSSPILRTRIDSLAIVISKQLALTQTEQVKWYLYLIDDYAQLAAGRHILKNVKNIVPEEQAYEAVQAWVNNDFISSAHVRALPLEAYKGKRSGGFAFLKLGKVLNREGKFKQATKELKAYAFAYPKHEYYPEALAMLNEAKGRSGLVSAKVGVILPLTGRFAVYGESVLHGIECAVGVYEPCRKRAGIQLLVEDTGGKPELAAAAVNNLADQGVIAIIGPLLSKAAPAAAKAAQEKGVPLITVSQRQDIYLLGDYIFRNTVTANSQVAAVTKYARQRDLTKFLLLYPRTKKGEEYKQLFEERVLAEGGEVVASYPFTSSHVELATDLMSMPFKEEGGIPFYQAVFIPDSFSIVAYLVPMLEAMGVENKQYLGIARWNDPRLVEIAGEAVEGAVFPVAFNKDGRDHQTNRFVADFKQAYGLEPTLLEALGFDSMNMISHGLLSGAAYRDSLKTALARLNNFQGVAGDVRFNSQRDAIRNLPLLTVRNGKIVSKSY